MALSHGTEAPLLARAVGAEYTRTQLDRELRRRPRQAASIIDYILAEGVLVAIQRQAAAALNTPRD